MTFVHEDLSGRVIDVGDIVVFTEPGKGRNLPPLRFGEVVDLTKSSVKVFMLDKNYKRETYPEMVDDTSQPPVYTYANGRHIYKQRMTGKRVESPPVAVKNYGDRFYIARKV